MLPTIQLIFFLLTVVFILSTVYYTFRYRREKDAHLRSVFQARNNISMGLLLILFAIAQNFYFSESLLRRVLATIFVLIGIFNFYVGLRNLFDLKKK
jgi:hypothetical protein